MTLLHASRQRPIPSFSQALSIIRRGDETPRPPLLVVALVLDLAMLMLISVLVPVDPPQTDRTAYEQMAQDPFVHGCTSFFCYRLFVPLILRALPFEMAVNWQVYFYVAQAAAALAYFLLVRRAGGSRFAQLAAGPVFLSSYGSALTFSDPFNVDPAVYLIAPLLFYATLAERWALASVLAVIGALTKEFPVVVPCLVLASHVLANRGRNLSRPLLGVGIVSIAAFVLVRLGGQLLFEWSLTSGSSFLEYLVRESWLGRWYRSLGLQSAIQAFFSAFAALWFLAALGCVRAPRPVQLLALLSLPAMAWMVFLAQPDRALANFAFLLIPLALGALDTVPVPLAATTLAVNGVLTLRLGTTYPLMLPPTWLLLPAVLVLTGAASFAWIRTCDKRHSWWKGLPLFV